MQQLQYGQYCPRRVLNREVFYCEIAGIHEQSFSSLDLVHKGKNRRDGQNDSGHRDFLVE